VEERVRDAPEGEFDDQVSEAVKYLSSIGHHLRFSGLQLVVVTVATLVLVAGLITRILALQDQIGLMCVAGLVVASIALAIRFESLKKRGDVLFRELSEELQWHVRFDKGREKSRESRPAAESRPALSARVALREFAQSVDLPLIPGRYGPSIYVAINLVLLFAVSYIRLFSLKGV
jgi:hypothetical protein